MAGFGDDDWRAVSAIFERALELSPAARTAFVKGSALAQPLRDEVLSLLAAVDETDGFLETPAAELLLPGADAPPAHDSTGEQIGPYRLLRRLGQGGMGEVWLAERVDGLYTQQVAVKLLRIDSVAQLERFNTERQLLVQLQHPSIARLLDGGITDTGRPYTIMELVDGGNLVAWCRTHESGLGERLRLFLEICDAVAYAHAHRVIHGDIKPGNLMVDAEGRAKLLDFGVATLLDPANTSMNGAPGAAPFTPDYAAPEALRGEPATTLGDVYALGVCLFELLAGRRPFQTGGLPLPMAIEQLLHTPAPNASSAAQDAGAPLPARLLAGDLDAIIARALQKPAEARYTSVAELAADLRRHLAGDAVNAREGQTLYAAGRLLRRHRRLALASGVALLSAIAGGAAYLHAQHRLIEQQLKEAQLENKRDSALDDFLSFVLRTTADGAKADMSLRKALETGIKQVFDLYADRPATLANVVLRLSNLFNTSGDTESAAGVLEPWLERFGAQAQPEDLAAARSALSFIEARRGNVEHAEALLREARAFWATDPDRYRGALLYSRIGEVQDLSDQIETDRAIEILEQTLAELQHLGSQDASLQFLYQNLAGTLMEANRFSDAERAFEDGWALATRNGLDRNDIALSHLSSWAVFESNRGRLVEAERRYRESIALRRELYGESAQLAAALAGLGYVLKAQNRIDEAMPLLGEARAMAARYSGPKSPGVIFSVLYAAEARLLEGRLDEAQALLTEDLGLVDISLATGQIQHARLQELQGRLHIARREYTDAASDLSAAEARFRGAGDAGKIFLARTLNSRGELALALARPGEALAPLQEALGLRQQLSGPDTWQYSEAASALGEAWIKSGSPEKGRPLLENAARILRQQLGPEHPLTRKAAARLADSTPS